MIAVRVHTFGGPEVISVDHIPIPEPGEGQALVRVLAAGVGPWDALVRSGKSGIAQSLPLTLGSDIAGTVENLHGNGNDVIREGDAVFGVTNSSFTDGYAEYAIAELSSIARKPQSLSFVEAAGVPVVAVTAWKMLFEHAKLVAGQSVLVLGGAGNVGAYAVQLARDAGATVTASGSIEDAKYMKSIGANITIDYKALSLKDRVSSVEVVVDTVGGEAQAAAFDVLKKGGALVSSVSPPSEDRAKERDVRVSFFIVDVRRPELERIAKMIDDGTLKADLGVTLGLAEARKAHEMLAGTVQHPRGKIVLDTTRA
jgi:NADPH:quinone reductase-like Zn-dependent oxidoreductase